MHSCMHAWMGRRAIGHTAIGHTAPTPISHIAHPSHTPTWLKSHVHYESFRTHAPRDVPKINTHAVGWTSTHPPTASVKLLFDVHFSRQIHAMCRFADLPICRSRAPGRTRGWWLLRARRTRSRLWVSRTTTETTRTTTETTCIRRRRAWNHTRGDGRGVSRRVDDVYDDDGDGTVAPIVVIRRPSSVRRRRRRTHTRAHAHSAHACLNTRRTRAS